MDILFIQTLPRVTPEESIRKQVAEIINGTSAPLSNQPENMRDIERPVQSEVEVSRNDQPENIRDIERPQPATSNQQPKLKLKLNLTKSKPLP